MLFPSILYFYGLPAQDKHPHVEDVAVSALLQFGHGFREAPNGGVLLYVRDQLLQFSIGSGCSQVVWAKLLIFTYAATYMSQSSNWSRAA